MNTLEDTTELLGWSTCWCCSNSCPRHTRHALHFLLGEQQADPNTQGFPNYTSTVAFRILGLDAWPALL